MNLTVASMDNSEVRVPRRWNPISVAGREGQGILAINDDRSLVLMYNYALCEPFYVCRTNGPVGDWKDKRIAELEARETHAKP